MARTLGERKHKRYGWIPDLPDNRDLPYLAPHSILRALPPSVDLRPAFAKIPAYDQGQLGSCTANAIAGALQYDQNAQKEPKVMPSRLFIYYNERKIEGTVQSDSGAMIRDGIKSVSKQGAPHETLWPYTIAKFKAKPSPAAYRDGLKHPAILYQRLTQTLDQLKGCLAAGFPFVFGFTVYESFESAAVAKSGDVPLPSQGEQVLGGHAVLAVGYDDSKQRFIVMNSWGTGWGKKGFFTMPYAYMTDSNLADDLWTVRIVE
jgi:C1A family cysteine protease